MPIVSLEERMDFVPAEDYLRAYTLLYGEERAKVLVDEMITRLTANTEDHMVLDPRFIALLALFSSHGQALAAALLKPEQLTQYQRELAAEYVSVGEAFPELLP